MHDTVQRTAAPQTLSPATRLFDGAIARREQCGCDGSVVTILRGFDARSRSMARTIRDRLHSRGVRARVLQASVAASPGHLAGLTDDDPLVGHSCAFVDVTAAASSEAERLAGWFDAPLVSLAGTGAPSTESQPLLKLRMHVAHAPEQVAFPSAAGVEPRLRS